MAYLDKLLTKKYSANKINPGVINLSCYKGLLIKVNNEIRNTFHYSMCRS